MLPLVSHPHTATRLANARVMWAATRFAWWWSIVDLLRRGGIESRHFYGRFYDGVTGLVTTAGSGGSFLNYGYASAGAMEPWDGDDALDPTSRASLALYRRTATDAGTFSCAGLDVLEAGAGLGGGAAWLARHERPRRMVALDVSAAAVRACRERHLPRTGLSFEHGDAQALPFVDDSFDVVLSVESSHTYPRFDDFVREARRVLRDGGLLLLADFRAAGRIERLREEIAREGFEIEVCEDVTDNVVAALRQTSAAKERRIASLALPRFVARQVAYFAGATSSEKFARFARRDDVYLRLRARKRGLASAGSQA